MKVKRLTAAILAAAITVSSIAPEALAEISGAGGTSTVNESADPASGGSDKAEESGKTVSASEPGEGESDYTYNALDDGTIEITGYSGSAENIVIPAQIDGKSVTRIGNNAFEKSSAKEIVIPDSVTEIGSQAFSGCGKLTGVSIPNSVTTIRDRAFFDCNSLASITIPDSVTDIELQAFCNCTSLKEVTIPASVTYIGDEAFGYYSDIDGSEIKKVDGFKINYVKNTYGHYYATKNGFSDEDCLLTNELDDGTLEISNYAGNSATYEIPGEIDGKKVVRIGDSAFINCTELTSVTIPDSVTDIRWRAFYNCVSLKSVTIPKSVIDIDNYAFGYYYDSDSFGTKKIDGFKINYVKNTYGHMYALKNGFTDEACLLTNELDDGTLEITKYVGNSATCVIPSEINGKKVTQIGYNAFSSRTELTSITIPDGVTIIGNSAFSDCTSLETVTIPNSVTHIYPRAFYNCTSLKEVAIPASVTVIRDEAFGYYYDTDSSETKKADGFKINYVNNTQGHWYAIKNGFTDGACFVVNELGDGTVEITGYAGNSATCVIPDEIDGKKVTKIGENAFRDRTELTSVTIPDGVTYIVDCAFFGCTSLETVTIPNSVINICSSAFYNCTSLKEVTIPASVTYIGDEAFGYYSDIDGSEIKKVDGFKINYVKNTYGHYYATKNGFSDEDCLLTNELDDGTLEISNYAGNSATYEIPGEIDGKKVVRIGDSAFINCTELTSVTIPDSVTDIRWRAFYNCVSLKSVTIPKSVIDIDNYAFGYYYDSDSFGTKKIDGFKINYVKNTYGHMYALKNGFTDEACLLTNELDDGTLEITKYVGNSATCVIPSEINGKKVTQIGYNAFSSRTELTSITIPDGVTIIGNSAFSDCTSLETVTIPNSVTHIYPRAFYNCTSLKEVAIPASVTVIRDEAFGYYYDTDSSETKKADGFKINYVNNTQGHWYAIKNGFTDGACFVVNELGDGTVEITGYAGNSATCVIPDEIDGKKVTKIGENAFRDRTELTSVTIPDSVTKIGDYAFSNCNSLTEIKIPNKVKSIGGRVFWFCESLKNVTIPDSVTMIGDMAFVGCKSLTDITIPGSVTMIGDMAFSGCKSLTDITIPDSVTMIGDAAFANCTSLTDITIPGSVTMIGDHVFAGCTSLTDITIPGSVTMIGNAAFGSCTSLTDITIPDSVTSIGDSAFYNCPKLINVTIPDSVTNIDDWAFGFDENDEKIDGFKIYCYGGTAGEQYAKDNGFEYKILECKVHKFGEWTITKEASCTKDGEKVRVCSLCNKTETETIPATGHTEVIDKAVAATCTKTGLTEGKHCSVCNVVIKAQETVPATGHKYVGTVVKPTYTAKGYTLHKCSVCGESYKDIYTAKLTLAKVTGVKLGGRAADALRINWTKNTSADGYIVEMYQGNKWVRAAKITSNGTTTFRKAGLSASTVYKFRVRAYKMEGKTAVYSEYSATVAASTNPSVMTGAKLTGRAADALRINWSKNASADGYIVEMYQGNKWVRVAKITSNNTTTFKKSGLKASSVYKFRVRAYKMSGSTALYGNYSATVTARTNPSVMTGAKLGGRAADALRINWSKNASADGYIVEMYQGNKWVRVAKITSNGTTTYRASGLSASTVYKFRVRAYKMSGKTALYGNYSATVTARTNPSVMTGVKIAGKAKDALRVNWTKNASAQGYIVEMYQGGKWVRVAKITNGNTTTFRKAGLAKNTAYKFRVCAYHMSGKTALYGGYGSVSGKTAAK